MNSETEKPKKKQAYKKELPAAFVPDTRLKKAFSLLMDTEHPISKGAALRAAGYSESTADSPSKVIGLKRWDMLMDKYLSETKLTKRHSELLDSKRDDVSLQAVKLGYELRKKLGSSNKEDGQLGSEELVAVVMRIRTLLPQ